MHDDCLDGHSIMSIAEYKTQAKKLQDVFCGVHPDEPCRQGCDVCLTAFCVECMAANNCCTSGKICSLVAFVH